MAPNTILATLAQIVVCGPCVGTFGRWKENLQDDDADLWKDLTLVNSIPDVKAPAIPKVVQIVSVTNNAMDDEDVSTLAYDSFHRYNSQSLRGRVSDNNSSTPSEEEKSFSPSPKRKTRNSGRNKNKPINNCNKYSDLELEQVLEEIQLEDDPLQTNSTIRDESGDAELESIMGPRSQISGMSRKSIQKHPPLIFEEAMPPPSLLQKQREQYTAVVTSKQGSKSSRMVSTTTSSSSHEDSKEEYREDYFDARSCSTEEKKNNPEDDHHDDGSSYSSFRRKPSFFRRNGIKRTFQFGRARTNNSSKSWLLAQGGSSCSSGCADHETYATMASTQNCSSGSSAYRSSRSRSNHSSNKYKAIP